LDRDVLERLAAADGNHVAAKAWVEHDMRKVVAAWRTTPERYVQEKLEDDAGDAPENVARD
jgi:hypothetical protein